MATNYNPYANVDNGLCEYPTEGCTNYACNFSPIAALDDGSCEFVSCAGCTIVIACNFSPQPSSATMNLANMLSRTAPAEVSASTMKMATAFVTSWRFLAARMQRLATMIHLPQMQVTVRSCGFLGLR